jgi:YD repeat-containing protein
MVATFKIAFEGGVFCRTTYTYDTKGRLLERITYIGTLSEERTTFQYDNDDDPIAETWSSRNRRAVVGDDGVVRTTEEEPEVQQHNQYEYQYDSRGNWIERVVSSGIESQPEFRRSNLERRTITYYEQ